MLVHSMLCRFGVALVGACAVYLGSLPIASAAGPIERLVQVMAHPTKPEIVVLRYGAAAEGFLFSRDGGRTFRATCTQAIAPELTRVSRSGSLYTPAALLDADGQLLVTTSEALWSDDGAGCAWATPEALAGKWVAGIGLDPATMTTFALANTATGMGDAREARAEVMRRERGGGWSSVGLLKLHEVTQRALGGDLLVTATPEGTRLYASLNVSVGAASAAWWRRSLVVSDDGGRTWRENGSALPAEQYGLTLLAVDPRVPDRVLGVVARTDEPDTLFLSEDAGGTFTTYQEIPDVSGVAFGPDGRVFIADAGDQLNVEGGVWTAAKLGDPLSRVEQPFEANDSVHCIGYDASSQKLRVCKLHRFGLLDPQDGSFEELVRFESVAGLVECPGREVHDACEAQLNEGTAWCCVGHYPFTPFCGDYNVTEQEGRRVECGLAGRVAELAAGRGPTLGAGLGDGGLGDAGSHAGSSADGAVRTGPNDGGDAPAPAMDAGLNPVDEGPKRKSSGCALGSDGPPRAGNPVVLPFVLAALCLGRALGVRRGRKPRHLRSAHGIPHGAR